MFKIVIILESLNKILSKFSNIITTLKGKYIKFFSNVVLTL